jgi:MFS family permease
VWGTALFAACSLAGGLAVNAGMLVGARLGQGAGAAMMAPAGLSILTTSFNSGDDRNRALGVWGAISGLAAAAGVFLGGVLSQGPRWRWVLFVNLPVCVLILNGAYRPVPGGRPAARSAGFDVPGAVLATGGMLLLVYALVRAPDQGWGSARTAGELVNRPVLGRKNQLEQRRHHPAGPADRRSHHHIPPGHMARCGWPAPAGLPTPARAAATSTPSLARPVTIESSSLQRWGGHSGGIGAGHTGQRRRGNPGRRVFRPCGWHYGHGAEPPAPGAGRSQERLEPCTTR